VEWRGTGAGSAAGEGGKIGVTGGGGGGGGAGGGAGGGEAQETSRKTAAMRAENRPRDFMAYLPSDCTKVAQAMQTFNPPAKGQVYIKRHLRCGGAKAPKSAAPAIIRIWSAPRLSMVKKISNGNRAAHPDVDQRPAADPE